MMTTGSKIYFKVAGAVWALAVVYGYVTETVSVGIWKGLSGDGVISSVLGPLTFGYKGGVGDHFGYGLLMGVAGVAAGLGAAHIAFRDGSPELAAAMDGDAPSTTRPSINASMWPFLGAIAAGLLLLGLANSEIPPSTPWLGAGSVLRWSSRSDSPSARCPSCSASPACSSLAPSSAPPSSLRRSGPLWWLRPSTCRPSQRSRAARWSLPSRF